MKRSQSPIERTHAPRIDAVPPLHPGPPPAGDIAPAPADVPAATQDAMPFPGPLAFVPRPPAMQEPAQPASVASSEMAAAATAFSSRFFQSLALDDDNPFGLPPFHLAASKGDLDGLHRMLAKPDLHIDAFDEKYASTALMSASESGQLAAVSALIAAGASLDIASPHFHMTALMQAVFAGHADTAACLLAAGADVNVASSGKKRTALMLAVQSDQVEMVRMLVRRPGIALNQTDASGDSALFIAVRQNLPGVVQCLAAAGAAVNLGHAVDRATPLSMAASRGYAGVVQMLLLRKDIAIDQREARGLSPLHFAVVNDKPDVVECLLAAGADMTLAAPDGNSALSIAVFLQRTAVVEIFMRHGACPQGVDFFDTAHAPFTITLADLQADLQTPADPDTNPLGMQSPGRLDQPLVFIDQLIAVLESEQVLLVWLRGQGLRMTCALPLALCLASLPESWSMLADSGRAASQQHKRWYCASALSRLPVLTSDGKAVQAYKTSGISGAAAERLTVVANLQVRQVHAMAEQCLISLGSAMLENLVQDCLAKTDLAYQVDRDALGASLVNAAFLQPVAQVIAAAWASALAVLGEAPALVPAGYTTRQLAQFMRDDVALKAPAPFGKALQRGLAQAGLLTAFRTLVGTRKEADALDLMFQIQCDQLRQYCSHAASMHAQVAPGEVKD